MTGKRRFGRVRQLASGRYQARYLDPDGIDRPAPVTFARKRDAQIWLSQKEAEITTGAWMSPDGSAVTLTEYADRWVTERPGLRPRTVELYRSLLRLHIVPGLGTRTLAEITQPMVRSWRTELLANGVGAVTVAKSYRLLRAVMATATDDEIIRRNPCRIPGAGTEGSPERDIATIPQVFALADAIGPRFRTLVLLATFTGLRYGELMALRRRNVNLTALTLRVEATVSEVGGQLVTGPPKSGAGVRTIAIPAALLPELRTHLDKYSQPGPNGLVFVGARGATVRRSNWHTVWERACRKAGVTDLHFHDLRHTGNTLAAGTGASLKELMSRMGHGSSRAALIYQHATPGRDRVIADALDVMVEKHLQDARGQDDGASSGT